MATLPPRPRPLQLSRHDLAGLSDIDRLRYNDRRHVWHANLGPFVTAQVDELTTEILAMVDANRQDGNKVKPAVLLDASPGLGKTTVAINAAQRYYRTQMALYGPTVGRDERIPLAWLTLTANTTMRTLQAMLCTFFGLPSQRGNAQVLADRAADVIGRSKTRVIFVDDIHFLDFRSKDGRAVANGFKWMATQYPVTFVFVGVGVDASGFIDEGLIGDEAKKAQTKRRWTPLTMEPFHLRDEEGRLAWRRLLLSIEHDLVLADARPGMVAEHLAGYLYARSTGHFASLMTLITRGCHKAITSGEEKLTVELLDTIKNDVASEEARAELEAALDAGTLHTRVPKQLPRKADAA
jgi:hypothetical protein